MAKGSAKIDDDDDEVGAPKKSNKLLLIIIALLVLVLIGGGAYWFFAIHGKENAKAAAAQVDVPPTYSKLEPFTVNLKDPGVAMQTGITLRVANDDVDANVKLRMPEIRNQILLLLSNQQSADLMTEAGKEKLGNEIEAAVNKILKAKTPKDGVDKVLFTSFIIQ
jgi:flagellar FliL protein